MIKNFVNINNYFNYLKCKSSIYIIPKWRKSKKNFLFTRISVIEEVILKRAKNQASKEKLGEKIKNELLNKKKKREEKNSYVSAQKVVKDYRERQKSHSVFKRKMMLSKKSLNFYDQSRENTPICIIRISG